jgi:hypothetical protein
MKQNMSFQVLSRMGIDYLYLILFLTFETVLNAALVTTTITSLMRVAEQV